MFAASLSRLNRFVRHYAVRPEQSFIVFQACLASFFIFVFGVYRIIQQDWALAVVDMALVVALLALIYFALQELYFRVVSLCFIAVVLLGSWVSIGLGGRDNLFWAYPVVLMMFYVLRIKEALWTSLISLAVLTVMHLLSGTSPTAFIACYLLVILFSFQFAYMMKSDNERLVQEASMDALTKTGNRRALDDAMLEAMADLAESADKQSLILLDIDFFKRINDDFGHDVGDACLRRTAQVLREALPRGASLYRFGGEEFAVLMQSGLPQACELAERLRASVEQAPLIRQRTVTISVGVAELASSDDAREWLHRADELLYQAKHRGRNRVCVRKVNLEQMPVEWNLGEGI
ncbi:MAG: hypothetical protein AseanaTS_10930 [Candidatus Pelagadaptatus aseana]|uniref:GGDEF domain-containing protein n=1 Tax=Candidatus Pelagadaptatus aseana TaxID=3120508 RepID=UPI0039B27CB9